VLTASATDGAGNVGEASVTFTVRVTYASLCALTVRFSSHDELCAGLKDAEAADRTNDRTARGQALEAYKAAVGLADLPGDRGQVLAQLIKGL
jgi:hypothetical protein